MVSAPVPQSKLTVDCVCCRRSSVVWVSLVIKAWFLVVQVGEGVHLCFLSGLIVEPLLSWVHAAGFERVGVIMWM